MAYILASLIASGTRVPYHTTSRTRLPEVTADALRSAAVRLSAETLRQSGPWFVRGHLKLSPEARQLLPPIMGGSRRTVSYDVSVASRGALLRAAEAGTMRRALASTLHLDSMGFADPERDARLIPPGSHSPRVISELDGGSGHGRPRDSAGRFTSASDDSSPESRALRASDLTSAHCASTGPTATICLPRSAHCALLD